MERESLKKMVATIQPLFVAQQLHVTTSSESNTHKNYLSRSHTSSLSLRICFLYPFEQSLSLLSLSLSCWHKQLFYHNRYISFSRSHSLTLCLRLSLSPDFSIVVIIHFYRWGILSNVEFSLLKNFNFPMLRQS